MLPKNGPHHVEHEELVDQLPRTTGAWTKLVNPHILEKSCKPPLSRGGNKALDGGDNHGINVDLKMELSTFC